MECLFFIVAIICLCELGYFVIGSLTYLVARRRYGEIPITIGYAKIEPDCDNCEYAAGCRKRKDMLEESNERNI